MGRNVQPRKLLVASAGVATITLLGACEDRMVTGNLVAPDPTPSSSVPAPRPSAQATADPVESSAPSDTSPEK